MRLRFGLIAASVLILGLVGQALAGPPKVVDTPEIDAGSASMAIALLTGVVALGVERFRRKR